MCKTTDGRYKLEPIEWVKLGSIIALVSAAISVGSQWGLLKYHTQRQDIHQTPTEKIELWQQMQQSEREWLVQYVSQIERRLAQEIARHLDSGPHPEAQVKLEGLEHRVTVVETELEHLH